MRLSFLIFTEIAKSNTREMFGDHQIAELNTRKIIFFSNREIKYPQNLIPFYHKLEKPFCESEMPYLSLVPHYEDKNLEENP